MNRYLRSIFRALACFLVLVGAGSSLRAQLNPNFRTTSCRDFLDLYQNNSSAKVKPEIISLYDFSSSMNRIMFHSSYPNLYWLEEGLDAAFTPMGAATSVGPVRKSYYAVRVTLSSTTTGSVTTYSAKPSLEEEGDHSSVVQTNLNSLYSINGLALVRPDGKVVTEAMVKTTPSNETNYVGSSAAEKDVRNWVRAASHARFQFTGGGLADTRTIDLPLHWCDIDPEQDLTGDPVPLKALKILDPMNLDPTVTDGYDVDSTYLGTSPQRMNGGSTSVLIVEGSGGWRYDYLNWILKTKGADGKYIIRDANDPDWTTGGVYSPYGVKGQDAFGFKTYSGLPRVSRIQAVKEASLRTWFNYQNDVFWSMRGLDSASAANRATPPSAPSAIPPSSVTVPTNNTTSGATRDMYSMVGTAPNGAIHMAAKRLAKLSAGGGTPLISSYAEIIAEYQATDPWSYLESETSDGKVYSCTKHFVMIFTDGNPKDEGAAGTSMPYLSGAAAGNTSIKNNKSGIDANGVFWNLPTIAGAAAHACDPGKLTNVSVTANSGKNLSSFLPFAIAHRAHTADGSSNLNPVQPIQTITIGLSLGINPNVPNGNDPATPTIRLKGAACFGNPSVINNLDPSTAIEWNPAPVGGVHDKKEIFFFDASNPEKLARSLESAFRYMTNPPSANVTSMPAIPYVGVGLGHQIYLGRFDPPENGGPAWTGDLMMFPTRESGGQTIIMGSDGNTITGSLDSTTAAWSAAKAIRDRGWQNRILYTRLPATSATPTDLIRISDSGTTWDTLKTHINGANDSDKLDYLRWVMGADISSSADPLPTRDLSTTDVMGDVIDSAPAAIEFSTLDTSKLPANSPLAAVWGDGKRFRVIFVGTNQGWLHAFGEVSWEESRTATDGKTYTVTQGLVDELWAFMPTDIFPYIGHFQDLVDRIHYPAVNGAPYIYHLDLPATGKMTGNGKVDSTEKAYVIFGLGKGGRSYYAINIQDPFSPKLGADGWTLIPDESVSYSSRLTSNASATAIARMGFSTCIPAVGRVIDTDQKYKDLIFFGGGYSCPDIETSKGATYGRTIIAVDASTGSIVKTWDFTSTVSHGPIASGVVPYRFFPNSGLVQRLYYSDLWGTLRAINGTGTGNASSSYKNFRIDSSSIGDWITTPRPVYRPSPTAFASDYIQTTLPAPFRVTGFPARTADPKISPEAVGIALVSGNRYDPLDLGYANKNAAPLKTQPSQHKITVVFDRQDSGDAAVAVDTNGIADTQLQAVDATTSLATVTPGNPAYFLASGKYGWSMTFPARGTASFVSKGIVPPMVLMGVVFYSYFTPMTVDPCSGGTGYSYTRRVCDVMRPQYANTVAVQGCTSGEVASWWGVASNLASKSVIAVIQAGNVSVTDPIKGVTQQLTTKTFTGRYSNQFTQPRTWRSVH